MHFRNKMIKEFEDTIKWIKANEDLSYYVKESIKNTKVYFEGDYPEYIKRFDNTVVTVSKEKSFASAIRLKINNPDKKIAVLNFANSVHPGGGVAGGAKAQEEDLCRISTLYPVIMDKVAAGPYYEHHKALNDFRATDSLIYSENIVICKSDDGLYQKMIQDEWIMVDVITMAAPHLSGSNGYGASISDLEQYEIHVKRALHMLTVAAHNNVDILVLGAFGCGAFNNNPDIVSKAYKEALEQFDGAFEKVLFAVYCKDHETKNYVSFLNSFGRKEIISTTKSDVKIKYNKYHEMILREFGYTLDEALVLPEDEQDELADKAMKYLGDDNFDLSVASDDIRDILGRWHVGQREDK